VDQSVIEDGGVEEVDVVVRDHQGRQRELGLQAAGRAERQYLAHAQRRQGGQVGGVIDAVGRAIAAAAVALDHRHRAAGQGAEVQLGEPVRRLDRLDPRIRERLPLEQDGAADEPHGGGGRAGCHHRRMLQQCGGGERRWPACGTFNVHVRRGHPEA
jgi:hypothetical protein